MNFSKLRFAAFAIPSSIAVATSQSVWNSNWDYRESHIRPNSKHHIFLIRHGQYVSKDSRMKKDKEGEEDFLYNDQYRVLTELGREQAKLTGQRLVQVLQHEGLLQGGSGIRVYTSDMTRANETGLIIHNELSQAIKNGNEVSEEIPCLTDSILREGAPIAPTGYNGPWNPPEYIFHEEGSRIESAFRKFIHRPDTNEERQTAVINNRHHTVDIVVCHGNLIRYMILRALQCDPGHWLHFSLYNGSITRLSVAEDGWVGISSIGDTGTMPPAKISYS